MSFPVYAIYQIEASRLQEVFDWVSHFERYWDKELDALGRDT